MITQFNYIFICLDDIFIYSHDVSQLYNIARREVNISRVKNHFHIYIIPVIISSYTQKWDISPERQDLILHLAKYQKTFDLILFFLVEVNNITLPNVQQMKYTILKAIFFKSNYFFNNRNLAFYSRMNEAK